MTEQEKTTKLLLERAKNNEHTEFTLLTSFNQLQAAKICKKAISEVIDGFLKTGKTIYDDYINNLKNGLDRLDLIISYKQIMQTTQFYKKEYEIIKDIISEYRCYLRYGHFMSSVILGQERPEQDLIDWRKLPIKL